MNTQKINKIFTLFSNEKPAPKVELKYTNNYTFLVAIILSAQATDVGVNKATKDLFHRINSPQGMLELGEGGLKEYIKTIGLYNNKAKNIIAMSGMLVNEYDGEIPDTLEGLVKLAGVGRKTASVYLNTVYNMPAIAVDTHVFRVSNRIGLVKTKTPLQTEKALQEIVPTKWHANISNWLVLHGRYICKARKPECGNCVIEKLCEFEGKVL